MVLADRVNRREQPREDDGKAGDEERSPLAVGEVGPAAAPEAEPAMEEEHEREHRGHVDRSRRAPGCVREEHEA
jgi:hypothetical protein